MIACSKVYQRCEVSGESVGQVKSRTGCHAVLPTACWWTAVSDRRELVRMFHGSVEDAVIYDIINEESLGTFIVFINVYTNRR